MTGINSRPPRELWTQHHAANKARTSSVSLTFEPKLTKGVPGVYRLEQIHDGKVVYVGEASDLLKRLTFLFRANSRNNPHPFHAHCLKALGKSFRCQDMCENFRVSVLATIGLRGRLEIEEEEKLRHRTNRRAFYNSVIFADDKTRKRKG